MGLALAAHDRIVRSAIEEHDGFVFSTAGGAFSAAFSSPGEAWWRSGGWGGGVGGGGAGSDGAAFGDGGGAGRGLLRAGGESGGAGDVGGARRSGSGLAGHGGLVRDRLSDGVSFVDLGEHALVGLARPERLFQVAASGLVSSFPLLRTGAAHVGNLVAPVTSFLGQAGDLARLVDEWRRGGWSR